MSPDTAPGSGSSSPQFPSEAADWLTVEQALVRILGQARLLPPRSVPLAEATGHIVAEEVTAAVTLPPWPNAGMDGYAVHGDDLAVLESAPDGYVDLNVVGEVLAGEPRGFASPVGSAMRIMTGAPVPEGFDSVVRVEDTDREGGTEGVVRILNARDRGRNIRAAGEDMSAGDLLVPAGTKATPGRVALLSAAGAAEVEVIPRPRVAIVPTGDELRTPDNFADVRRGVAIPEANGPALAAACKLVGAEPLLFPPIPDDVDALAAALRRAADEAHVILTLGGASMGTADLVKVALDRIGFELDFWRIRMRPGSPFSFGWLDGVRRVPVFGLPGNPASSFVTFQLLARPYLLAISGEEAVHRPTLEAVASTDLASLPTRTVFHRVTLAPGEPPEAIPTGPQGSGLVHSLGRAQGLAVVPAGESCPAGSPVKVVLMGDESADATECAYLPALSRGP